MRLISTLCLLLFSSFSLIKGQTVQNSNGIHYALGCAVLPKETGKKEHMDSSDDSVRKDSTKIILRCHSSCNTNTEPLIVVDGIPYEKRLTSLDPNDIESFSILKNASEAALHSSRANRSIIIITTKSSKIRKFFIKDFLDREKIAGATVSFISADKRDTIMMAANDSGVAVTDKLKSSINYQMSVSAIGYKSLSQSWKNDYEIKEQELLMERDIKVCDEVIVGGSHGFGCGRLYSCTIVSNCSMQIIADRSYSFSFTTFKITPAVRNNIFPNPAKRGEPVTIETTTQSDTPIELKITSLDGKQVLSQPQKAFKGQNRFKINTDFRWSAGIYFVQLYANGKLLASDKVVIQ